MYWGSSPLKISRAVLKLCMPHDWHSDAVGARRERRWQVKGAESAHNKAAHMTRVAKQLQKLIKGWAVRVRSNFY